MSDLLTRPLTLPLLERHREPPAPEEILQDFVERYQSRPLGMGPELNAPVAGVGGHVAEAPSPPPEEPTVLFSLPREAEAPASLEGPGAESQEISPEDMTLSVEGASMQVLGMSTAEASEEATRMMEAAPDLDGERGTPTMAFEALSEEPPEEATRMMEAAPDLDGEGGTPTTAFGVLSEEPPEEATRVMEATPDLDGEGGTPTMAFEALSDGPTEEGGSEEKDGPDTPTAATTTVDGGKKKKKRRHR